MAMTVGGGAYKRPTKNKRPVQANRGQMKKMTAKKTAVKKSFLNGGAGQENRLSDNSAKQLQLARSKQYNQKNPVKGGELKNKMLKNGNLRRGIEAGATMGMSEAYRGSKKLSKALNRNGAVQKLKKDAGDVWNGRTGYGKKIADFADEGFTNYLKNKNKKKVRKAPKKGKNPKNDGPVVRTMRKVQDRNREIEKWTQ